MSSLLVVVAVTYVLVSRAECHTSTTPTPLNCKILFLHFWLRHVSTAFSIVIARYIYLFALCRFQGFDG